MKVNLEISGLEFTTLGDGKMMYSVVKWYISIGRKVIRVVPFRTFSVVFLTCCAQILTIAAFLLPLKVLILIGSDGVPKFFPASWGEADRTALVLLLSGAALSAFVLARLLEFIVSIFCRKSAEYILLQSKKVPIVVRKEETIKQDYRKYLSTLSSLIFAAVALTVVGAFYPTIFLAVTGYLSLIYLPLAIFYFPGLIKRAQLRLLKLSVETLSSLGFLSVFFAIVLDFLFGNPPGFIAGIVTLLLIKQFFSHVTQLIIGMFTLYEKRYRIDPVFFHGIRGEIMDNASNVTADTGLVAEILGKIGTEFAHVQDGETELRWEQTGISGVSSYSLLGSRVRDGESRFVAKVYSKNRHSFGKHEKLLLDLNLAGLPAPKIEGSYSADGLWVNLLKFPSHCLPVNVESFDKNAIAKKVAKDLMQVEVPAFLKSSYRRSTPRLEERIVDYWLPKLSDVFAGDARVQFLSEQASEFAGIISRLPLTIHNPMVRSENVLEGNGRTILGYWGRWTLEPLGAGWPTTESSLEELEKMVDTLKLAGRGVHIEPKHVRIAALIYALDSQCARGRYQSALEILGRANEEFHSITFPSPSNCQFAE